MDAKNSSKHQQLEHFNGKMIYFCDFVAERHEVDTDYPLPGNSEERKTD